MLKLSIAFLKIHPLYSSSLESLVLLLFYSRSLSVCSLILLSFLNIILLNSLSDNLKISISLGQLLEYCVPLIVWCFLLECVPSCFALMSTHLRAKTPLSVGTGFTVKHLWPGCGCKDAGWVGCNVFGSKEGTVVPFMLLFQLRITLARLQASSQVRLKETCR